MATDEVKEITKETQELIKTSFVEETIKNNQIEFDIEGAKYRIRRPSFEQKQRVLNERTKKFMALLQDTSNLLEKDLCQIYESRGISISSMNRDIDALQAKRDDTNMKLGKLLSENRPESELLAYKQEIERINGEQNQLIMKKSSYLENSIESQVNVFTYVYLASLITEKLVQAESESVGASWATSWASYEDFIKEPEVTVNKVVWYASLISRNDLPTL